MLLVNSKLESKNLTSVFSGRIIGPRLGLVVAELIMPMLSRKKVIPRWTIRISDRMVVMQMLAIRERISQRITFGEYGPMSFSYDPGCYDLVVVSHYTFMLALK